MQKRYCKLTKDQIRRGVVFSSQLCSKTHPEFNGRRHEVTLQDYPDWEERGEAIDRLKDAKFFEDSHWDYCIFREGT